MSSTLLPKESAAIIVKAMGPHLTQRGHRLVALHLRKDWTKLTRKTVVEVAAGTAKAVTIKIFNTVSIVPA